MQIYNQCCLVYPILDGFVWIKWDDVKDKEKLYFKKYIRCINPVCEIVSRDEFEFHLCEKHMKD